MDLNFENDKQVRMLCGRLFHNVAAALENEPSPMETSFVRGENKVSWVDDREPARAGV